MDWCPKTHGSVHKTGWTGSEKRAVYQGALDSIERLPHKSYRIRVTVNSDDQNLDCQAIGTSDVTIRWQKSIDQSWSSNQGDTNQWIDSRLNRFTMNQSPKVLRTRISLRRFWKLRVRGLWRLESSPNASKVEEQNELALWLLRTVEERFWVFHSDSFEKVEERCN